MFGVGSHGERVKERYAVVLSIVRIQCSVGHCTSWRLSLYCTRRVLVVRKAWNELDHESGQAWCSTANTGL